MDNSHRNVHVHTSWAREVGRWRGGEVWNVVTQDVIVMTTMAVLVVVLVVMVGQGGSDVNGRKSLVGL